jgi:hypothetical protein
MMAETESFTSVQFFIPGTSQSATPRTQAMTSAANPSTAAVISEFPVRTKSVTPIRGRFRFNRGEESTEEVQVDGNPKTAPSVIDWAKEAGIAAADSLKRDAEASREATALSQWQSRAISSLKAPTASQFLWDYSRTHRLESSAKGLVVNLNDRCSILISVYLMAVMGRCKLGEPTARGNLFMLARDVPVPSDQAQH